MLARELLHGGIARRPLQKEALPVRTGRVARDAHVESARCEYVFRNFRRRCTESLARDGLVASFGYSARALDARRGFLGYVMFAGSRRLVQGRSRQEHDA